jgi:hypothetical protein
VVLVPEYNHFFGEFGKASTELLRIVFDVNISNVQLLSSKQFFYLLPYIPYYSLSKFNPIEYFATLIKDVYSVHSFNQYGDAYKHWGLKKSPFAPATIRGKVNPKVIQGIKKFQSAIASKGAILFVSYPCYQDISFKNSTEAIKEVEAQYLQNGFTVLGTPERYMMPDSLMFDSSYHLTKEGADYRTQLLIEDLKFQFISKPPLSAATPPLRNQCFE